MFQREMMGMKNQNYSQNVLLPGSFLGLEFGTTLFVPYKGIDLNTKVPVGIMTTVMVIWLIAGLIQWRNDNIKDEKKQNKKK